MGFNKILGLFFLGFALLGFSAEATDSDLQIKVDSYGQQWVKVAPDSNAPDQIASVKKSLSNFLSTHDGNAFFVTVPHTSFEKQLQQEGFKLYATTPDHREWIFKNNSPIPPAISGNAGAVGYIIHAGRVLLIEDRGRPGAFECPGGGMELGEYSDDAVIREVKEEVGLDVEIVQLVANSQRVQKKRYGPVNNHGYFYLLKLKNPEKETPTIDLKEIIQAKWVSLDMVDHLKLSPITQLILDHLRGRLASNKNHGRRVHLHELSKEAQDFLSGQMTKKEIN